MRRFFHIFTTLCILPIWLSAQTQPTFSGGDGSQAKPYLISNEADLQALAKASMEADGDYAAGKYFLQTADITFAPSSDEDKGNFIGISGKPRNKQGEIDLSDPRVFYFQGRYNGGEHKIIGMHVFNFIGSGFINALGKNGMIENLRFEKVRMFSTRGLSGTVAAINDGTIRRCEAISGFYVSLGGEIGGIAGANGKTGLVEQCANYINITSTMPLNYYFGGIVGSNLGKVRECANFGNIKNFYYAGGVAGISYGDSHIEYCYNAGNISCKGYDEGSGAGGITGAIIKEESAIAGVSYISCYNYGGISVEKTLAIPAATAIAGFVFPNATPKLQNCYFDENVSLAPDALATGLPTTDMKNAADKLNGTTKVYRADLDKPINKGYPILSWQAGENSPSEPTEMVMQFAEITIPANNMPYNILAISVPPAAPGKKLAWKYVSDDKEIVIDAFNQFRGKKVGTTTVTKYVGYANSSGSDMEEIIAKASFKVNVVPVDQYKPSFIEPYLLFSKSLEELKAFEAKRNYRHFTAEYFKMTGSEASDIEVFLTDNPLFPMLMYYFDRERDQLLEANLVSSNTFMVLSPTAPFASFMTSKGYDIVGISLTGNNVYHNPTTKITAQSTMFRVQGGIYAAENFAHDPNKDAAYAALSVDKVIPFEGKIFVSGRQITVELPNHQDTAVSVYSMDGRLIITSIAKGQAHIDLAAAGTYLLRIGSHTQKVSVH